MAITKEKKQELVTGYVNSLQDSQAVVFVQSRGLTVAEVTELRRRLARVESSHMELLVAVQEASKETFKRVCSMLSNYGVLS